MKNADSGGTYKIYSDIIESRREHRERLNSPIEFILKTEPERILRGIATNISKHGMGIFSYAPLAEGQEIIVRNPLSNGNFEYVVRWNTKLLENFFRVGLRTIDTK